MTWLWICIALVIGFAIGIAATLAWIVHAFNKGWSAWR